VRNQEVFEI